jgi:iron complex transport system permease protein
MPFAILSWSEDFGRDTTWNEHSHPFHELLWNERGVSTAVVGTRVWTITPSLGLWMPAGTLHSGSAVAGTRCRAGFFGFDTVSSISPAPVGVEISPLLRLLLERLADTGLPAGSRAVTEAMVLDVLTPSPYELLLHMPTSGLLRPIADAVRDDPGDQRTLADWASQLGVSARTITRAFNAETGTSFARWVAAVRAQHADAALVRRPARVRGLWLLATVVVLATLMVASVALGSRTVAWSDVWAALGGADDSLERAAVAQRIPRTLLAVLIGAALGVSGAVMQGVTRNPLADPGILGVNMGASLSVVTAVAFFGLASPTGYIWVALAGAAASAVFVHVVGSLGRGGATPLKLTLAGAATSAAFASLVSAVVLPRNDIAGGFRLWQIGGVGGASYERIGQVLPFLAAGFAVCLLSARALNSLALGDEIAAGLGERVAVIRAAAAFGAVVLCGAATAVAGPIAFVGLLVPHACRLLAGVDHRWLLPFAALAGASLLTASDVVGRVVARPEDIEVGIVTALIGAPFFIHIVRRQKVREL